MFDLKRHPLDKAVHGGISFLLALVGSGIGAAAAVSYFYGREQHTAGRYMRGGWRSWIPSLWAWEAVKGKPTAKDTQWDFYISVIGAGIGLLTRQIMGM